MGHYIQFDCVKKNKRTERIIELKTVRALLEHLKRKDYLGAKQVKFEGYHKADGVFSEASLVIETEFSIYKIIFSNLFDGVRFCLKHNICKAEQLIEGTILPLRSPVLKVIEGYSIARIKRKIRSRRDSGKCS